MKAYRASEYLRPEENINVQRERMRLPEPPHTHDFAEMVYILSGSGVHQIDRTDYPVRKGTFLFINYGQIHAFSSEGGMEYMNVLLRPEFFGKELIHSENAFQLLSLTAFEEFQQDAGPVSPLVSFAGAELIEADSILEGMHGEFTRKEAGYRTVLHGYLEALLAKVFRKMFLPAGAAPGGHASMSAALTEILPYIEQNCCERLTLNALAQKCFYHPAYFSRIFREYFGVTLTDFIHQKRIERACEYLRDPTLTVEEVMRRVGYADRKQFYLQFRRYTGGTPRGSTKSPTKM